MLRENTRLSGVETRQHIYLKMSSFSESSLTKKLHELNNSQQSIQTLSLWLIHHRKHSKTIVDVWLRELQKVKSSRKLTFVYLANDVVQNSKKKGPEFTKDFAPVLMEALNHVAMEADEKTQQALGRLCNIWKERNVFEKHLLHELKQALSGKSEPKEAEAPPVKKSKLDQTKLEQLPLSLREEIAADISDSPKEPPDAEELVRALQDLENSASTDAAVRERIAALPPEVSDIAMLEKIKDRETVDRLSREVEDASLLLAEYNSRLSKELEERKHIAQMLKDFIAFQKDQLTESEKRLDEYKQKLGKVSEVRNELRSHIQNLPDLSLLPDVTGGLKPLPSAGDLFAKE